MKPLTKLGEKKTDNGSLWELWERDGALSLQLDGLPCATSLAYGSEQAMAEIAVSPITRATQPCVMIAGLGLGYGLAKAVERLPREKAKFIVAEPEETVVAWNKEFGENKAVFNDRRITIERASAAELCRKRVGSLHAILLRHAHARCELSPGDAQAFFNALKGGSLLAINLSKRDGRLENTLRKAGFEVTSTTTPASAKGKQTRLHTIVLARRGRFVPFAER